MHPYTIDDPIDIADHCSVEVTVAFPEGQRWLFFATPKLLETVGDFVEDSRTRVHFGELHMIIVSEISPEIIDAVLRALHADGQLYRRTLPLEAR
jgi:hypothetical protein